MVIKLSAFSDESANDLHGQIAGLKRNRIFYTELRNIDGKNVADLTLSEAKNYRNRFADEGISLWAIGSPLGKVSVDIDMDQYIDTVKHVCELANVFGTKNVRVFSFYNAYDKPTRVFDNLNRMVEVAKEYGVLLCHENEKEIYGDTAERVSEIIKNVNGLKYVYDPANYIQTGQSADKTLNLFHAGSYYFHIKDVIAETGELVPAGYGSGKIKELIEKISEDKVLSVEPHLAVFEGYGTIDHSIMKHKFIYKSNIEAFDTAVTALKELLKGAGFHETDEGFIK